MWTGGALFVGALAFCAWWYLVPLGETMPFAGPGPVAFDAAIFSVFALHHSVFARDGVKRAIARIVPDVLMRSVYVWGASLLLVIVCWSWRRIGGDLYHASGIFTLAHAALQLSGLWLIAQSVRGLDPLELAGIHRAAQGGGLQITGPYHWVRHPLYAGWILATFGTAHMTGDRLAFAVITGFYLLAAVPFEEASLLNSFGEDYRRYRQRVRWRVIPYVY